MITEIELNEALVTIPQINAKIELLFRNAQLTQEEKDKVVILSLKLQEMSNKIASWAAGI